MPTCNVYVQCLCAMPTFKRLPGSRAHKCAILNGLQKTFDCDPCGERFECESKLVKHNQKNHCADGINYRQNKAPISGIPPQKKTKQIDDPEKDVPENEPMDVQTIEVAAMQAALGSDLMDQNLQISVFNSFGQLTTYFDIFLQLLNEVNFKPCTLSRS